MLASGGAAVLANDGAATGCVEVTEAGASDANASKPLDEKSDNGGYVRTSAEVGDEVDMEADAAPVALSNEEAARILASSNSGVKVSERQADQARVLGCHLESSKRTGESSVREALLPREGRLVVIEGLDGSGKETQASLLRKRLLKDGIDLRSLSFPCYKSDSSALVRMYLEGRFGSKPNDVNAYAASAFYAVDRYASYKENWGAFYEAGGLVLADRWTTSNAVHQCAKLPRSDWDTYLDWLFDFEYRLIGVPKPDLVVYLSMGADVSTRLVEGRCAREGTAKDVHEADASYMQRCREAADYCADRLGWKKVECAPEGALRTMGDIHEEIARLVEQDGR